MNHELPHHELIARGVIVRNGALLVNRSRNAKTGETYCALPGGHVDAGENCRETVRRELVEELGANVEVGDLCFVAESVYAGRHSWDGRRQEVVLYFRANLTSELRTQDGEIVSPESDKSFVWLPLGDLNATNLLPLSFKKWLQRESKDEEFARNSSASTSISPLYDFHDSTTAANAANATSSTR